MMEINKIEFEDCGYAFVLINENDEIEKWLFCFEINRCIGCEIGKVKKK